jgi:hypothetical protein
MSDTDRVTEVAEDIEVQLRTDRYGSRYWNVRFSWLCNCGKRHWKRETGLRGPGDLPALGLQLGCGWSQIRFPWSDGGL